MAKRKTMQEAHAELHDALRALGRTMLSGGLHTLLLGVWIGMAAMLAVVVLTG